METHCTLALDVGDRRIGLAITDPLGVTAQPLFTLHRGVPKPNLRAESEGHRTVHSAARSSGGGDRLSSPRRRNAQPAIGEDACLRPMRCRSFVREAHPQLTFHLLDERLTSLEAHSLLDHAGKRSGKSDRLARSEKIDQIAAVLLLEKLPLEGLGHATS